MTHRSEAMDKARQSVENGGVDGLFARLSARSGGRAGVRAVFGKPIEHGEITVIPVARVRWFFAGARQERSGSGRLGGDGQGQAANVGSGPLAGNGSLASNGPLAGAEGEAQGAGSGGAGGATVIPVGYIEIGPSGAEFKQIVDPYPSAHFLIAAGISTAFILRGLARIIRG